MRNGLVVALSCATVLAVWTGPASAAVIFSDAFGTNGNALGNSWVEIEEDSDDVAVVSNQLQLRDNNSNGAVSAAATRTISTLGFNTITLSFDWAPLDPSDVGDTLFAEWRVGNAAWTTATGGTNLATLDLGGSTSFTSSGSLSLGAAADNLADLEIRFRTLVSNGTPGELEGALVDNVVVSGNAITSTPIPEPLTVSIFGAGLAGALGVRRRRTSKA